LIHPITLAVSDFSNPRSAAIRVLRLLIAWLDTGHDGGDLAYALEKHRQEAGKGDMKQNVSQNGAAPYEGQAINPLLVAKSPRWTPPG
jgi:hypothetical protein